MSIQNHEYFLLTSWADLHEYGIKVHKARSCPYRLRQRLILNDEGQQVLTQFLGIPVGESVLVGASMWTDFAKWILVHVEKCKWIGITPDGKVAGIDEPTQLDYIDAQWEGPFPYHPAA